MRQETGARIGMVNYINTAPLYEIWRQTVHQPAWRVIEAPPSVLSRMLYNNELDLGLVSSYEYAAHPADYRILADLSISSTGPVGSVFLFSRVPVEELAGQLVILSDQSKTSASLVKIILEEFYGLTPRYAAGQVYGAVDQAAAVLAIGDDALRLAREKTYRLKLDLGEVWHRHTGLPFVFAVWAVRKDYCAAAPDSVGRIHRELLRCVAAGRQELMTVSRQVAPRIPMNPQECYDYLQAMEYDLDLHKRQALGRYFDYLIKRGEGDAAALPLEIVGLAANP